MPNAPIRPEIDGLIAVLPEIFSKALRIPENLIKVVNGGKKAETEIIR